LSFLDDVAGPMYVTGTAYHVQAVDTTAWKATCHHQ